MSHEFLLLKCEYEMISRLTDKKACSIKTPHYCYLPFGVMNDDIMLLISTYNLCLLVKFVDFARKYEE